MKATALKKTLKKLIKNESGQGATEYILLLVVVVGIATMFGPRIKEIVGEKLANVGSQISGFDMSN